MKSLNTIIVAMLETEREYDDGQSLHFYKHKDGDTQWILCYITHKRLREKMCSAILNRHYVRDIGLDILKIAILN